MALYVQYVLVDDPQYEDNSHGLEESREQQQDGEMRPHGCKICGKAFKKGNQLKQHLVIHLREDERPYACTFCDRKFTRQHHLTLHQVTHTKKTVFKCPKCNTLCRQKSDLVRHLLTHRERAYPCQHCKKTFADEDRLRTHMVKQHTREPFMYPCNICERTFSRQKNCYNHVLTHTAEKTYRCTYCEKAFVQESSLKQHVLAHTRKESYTCSDCGRSFTHRGNFQTHRLTHTQIGGGVSCDVCGKVFLQIASYKRHVRTHRDRNAAPEKEVSNPQTGSSEETDLPPITLKPQVLSTENENLTSIAAYADHYDELLVADVPKTVDGIRSWLMTA